MMSKKLLPASKYVEKKCKFVLKIEASEVFGKYNLFLCLLGNCVGTEQRKVNLSPVLINYHTIQTKVEV
jgi:hypothetical protein